MVGYVFLDMLDTYLPKNKGELIPITWTPDQIRLYRILSDFEDRLCRRFDKWIEKREQINNLHGKPI